MGKQGWIWCLLAIMIRASLENKMDKQKWTNKDKRDQTDLGVIYDYF